MTDFLTRLLARTRGTIPSEQLAQPLLKSAFAPNSMSMESPIEVYEEQEGDNMTSSSSSQKNQPSKSTEQHYDAEVETDSDQMPYPSRVMPVQHSSALEGGVQEIVQRQSVHTSANELVEEKATPDISYSQKTIPPSLSSPSSRTILPVSQVDAIQPALQSYLPFEKDEKLSVEEKNIELPSRRDAKLSTKDETVTIAFRGESNFSGERENVDRENTGEMEQTLLQEQDVFVESPHMNTSSQRAVMFEPTTQAIRRVDSGKSGVEPTIPVESTSSIESVTGIERESKVSARQVRIVENERQIVSSEPVYEQESIVRVETTRLLPNAPDTGERELMQREVSRRVEQKLLHDEQEQVSEAVRHEQPRRDDSSASRRAIPTQTHIAQQQETILSVRDAVHMSAMPETPPTIQVSIGRIEVRAVTVPTPQPRAKPARPSPSLSLEDYLKQQKGER